jgi:transposase
MDAYPAEFRGEVLAARDAGASTHEVAVRFQVSKAWVRRIVQQRRETGQIAAKTARKRTPKWHAWVDWLLAKLDARPDIYLRELQADLKSELGEEASLATLCAACGELKRTRKKRRLSRPSRIAPMS